MASFEIFRAHDGHRLAFGVIVFDDGDAHRSPPMQISMQIGGVSGLSVASSSVKRNAKRGSRKTVACASCQNLTFHAILRFVFG